MQRSWWFIGGAVAVVLGVWLFVRSGEGRVAIDLVAEFDNAKEKRPTAADFSVVDATLAGATRRAIRADHSGLGGSRLTYNLTVPNNAWLSVGIGQLESAWTVPGDGVLFRVLVAVGDRTEELLNYTCNPFASATDRRWHEMELDLSPYAGENIDLKFNTNSSPPSAPGTPPKDDRNGDAPVWGAPRIIVR
jgi:hypothetical protein